MLMAIKRKAREEAERLTWDVPELAARLGISKNSAYEAVKSGQIPSITVGHRILVPRAAVERLLAQAGATA